MGIKLSAAVRHACVILVLAVIVCDINAQTMTPRTAPGFRTLLVEVERVPEAPPVIMTHSSDRLHVCFDELSTDRRNLRFRLRRYTPQWDPSELTEPEYLESFNEWSVPTGQFSRATMTHYVHYSLTIPGDAPLPVLSGNYAVEVFDELHPSQVLVSAPFCVCDREARVTADVNGRTDVDYQQSHQQLTVTVNAEQSGVDNPYTDLIVRIMQADAPFTTVELTTPSSVAGRTATYAHMPQLIFNGGNEYRRMEIVSTEWPGMGMDHWICTPRGHTAVLRTDVPRAGTPYYYDRTQGGRFKVREYNSQSSHIEADYVEVAFSLRMPPLPDGEIHIDGDLTQRNLNSNSRMDYNYSTGCYEKRMLLKQGAYNYRYVAIPPGKNPPNFGPTEGNHYETHNRYNIAVYYRRPTERHHRLAAFTTITMQ